MSDNINESLVYLKNDLFRLVEKVNNLQTIIEEKKDSEDLVHRFTCQVDCKDRLFISLFGVHNLVLKFSRDNSPFPTKKVHLNQSQVRSLINKLQKLESKMCGKNDQFAP